MPTQTFHTVLFKKIHTSTLPWLPSSTPLNHTSQVVPFWMHTNFLSSICIIQQHLEPRLYQAGPCLWKSVGLPRPLCQDSHHWLQCISNHLSDTKKWVFCQDLSFFSGCTPFTCCIAVWLSIKRYMLKVFLTFLVTFILLYKWEINYYKNISLLFTLQCWKCKSY